MNERNIDPLAPTKRSRQLLQYARELRWVGQSGEDGAAKRARELRLEQMRLIDSDPKNLGH